MNAHDFGRKVEQGRRRRGFSKGELARRLGRLPESGRVFDARGVSRIEDGGPVKVDAELVGSLIDVLDLDAHDARERVGFDAADLWHAAGLWPPDLRASDYRDFVAAGGAAPSAAIAQAVGTKMNRSHRALRLVRAA